MNRLVIIVAILAIFSLQTNFIFAQEPVAENVPTSSSATPVPGFCDPYLKADSVRFEVVPSVQQTIPGSTVTFTGAVKNTNSYPILNADIWARVYRTGDSDDRASDIIVGQFLAQENLTLFPDSELPFTFSWKVPEGSVGGSYYVVVALNSLNNYPVIGFEDGSDKTIGNQAGFSVLNKKSTGIVYLKPDTLKLAGESNYSTGVLPVVRPDDSLLVSVAIKNPSNEKKRVPLQWSQYAWGSENKENLRHSKTQVVELAGGETKTLTYAILPQSEGVVEVTAVTQDGESKSIVPVRFAQQGHVASEVVFAGLVRPIITTNEEQTMSACVRHYEIDTASQYSLTFILRDMDGTVIHEFEQSSFQTAPSEVVTSTFTPNKHHDVAILSVVLKHNGTVVEETTIPYDCAIFDSTKCVGEEPDSVFIKYGSYILLAVAVLALVSALVVSVVRKRRYNIVVGPMALLFLIGVLLFGAVPAFAQGCTVGSETMIGDADGFADMRGATECDSQNYLDPAHGGTGLLGNYAQCDPGLTAGETSSNGACVSRVTFEPNIGPADRCVVRGYSCTPYSSAPSTPVIAGPTTGIVSTAYSFDFTSTDPDGDQIRYGLSDATCTATYEWFPGSGYVNSGTSQTDSNSWGTAGSYTMYVFAEDSSGSRSGCASHTITVSAPASCVWNYRMKEGIDDIVDLWGNIITLRRLEGNYSALPQCDAGLSASSAGQTAPPGSPLQCKISTNEKLVKVGAGCAAGPAADLKINGSDTAISVNKGDALTLDWVSTNAVSCSLYGAGLPGGSASLNGNTQVVATVSDSYVLTCDGAVDQVDITVTNRAPDAPTITHPTGTAGFGVNTSFTITGIDPDNDDVFYEIDWDNDGVYNVATAPVPSGTGVLGINGWTATGPQTFQARTVDASGLRSGWTTHTITINVPTSAASANLEASINGGSWSSSDQTVNITDSVALRWSSTNATNCSGTGSGFSVSGTGGSDNVTTPSANDSITFDLTCSGPGGDGSDSLVVTTRQLPNLTVSQNASPQYGTFDQVAGTYSQVTVFFRTQNSGGSDTTSSADYRFELDLNNDGSYETDVTRNDGIGTISVAGGENDSETVSGPIPFGTHGVRITADSSVNPGKVSETNEGDNVYTGTITTAPPDPGLSITANPTRVQNGQNSVIDWSAANPYSINCSLFGPGMVTRSFNLLSATAADHNIPAGPITAKSEYTISCTAGGATFTDTVTVETQGVIEET